MLILHAGVVSAGINVRLGLNIDTCPNLMAAFTLMSYDKLT